MEMAMITTIATMTTMALRTLKRPNKSILFKSDHLQRYFDTSGQMGRLPPGMWQPSKDEEEEENHDDYHDDDHDDVGNDNEGEDEEKDEKVALRYILIAN